ncbi:hypothetical protein [Deinococcus peraridilitoris]|uniref:Uncharacterized protein n=1 Tax=Deinococcus peraridilitoris (strain DSM 19664 / LMG 22246 / CIP 109416 / KR-200) TaxID=937777 RepID=K9ZZW3_DEIPD|nr:hypothetical protein [Deinococcus peraridilitoris]AFZ67116.1 hypothetical protein Deipe_1575 [Deinococcus peraridilitoris DSM 19664]
MSTVFVTPEHLATLRAVVNRRRIKRGQVLPMLALERAQKRVDAGQPWKYTWVELSSNQTQELLALLATELQERGGP